MSATTEVVRASTIVELGPADAFEVFTDEVDAWWRTGPRFRPGGRRGGALAFEPGPGGHLAEHYDDGAASVELARVLAWEPGARLLLELTGPDYEPGQTTRVEIRFDAVAGGTRVSIEHTGWEAFGSDAVARHGLSGDAFESMLGYHWGDLLVAFGRASRARKAA